MLDSPDGEGVLVWSQLRGSDQTVHVPYFELAAVYEAVVRHKQELRGMLLRCGVDSAPVVNAINTMTSRDPHMMRLLRAIADASIDHAFDVCACHVTRKKNLLADQATRHATTQDLAPYLAPEGYDARAAAGTSSTFPNVGALQNGVICSLRLGPRARSRSKPRPTAR